MAPSTSKAMGSPNTHPSPYQTNPRGRYSSPPLPYSKPIPLQPQQDTARPQAEQQTTTYATTPLPQLEPP